MNYYDILGVKANATEASIRRAFRNGAKRLHPDINSSADAKIQFQRINEAYQVLSDSERRRVYDLRMAHGLYPRKVYYRPAGTPPPPGSRYAQRRKSPAHSPSRFEKVFDQFLFFFMLNAGIGPIIFGIYKATGEPVDGVDPVLWIFFGVVFTSLFLYVWDKKQRTGS